MNSHEQKPYAVRSVAEVVTPNASRYLQQLCKHFAHKLPATFDTHSGQVAFAIGECRLDARDGVLELSLATPDDAQMAQLQDIIARHLLRFAFREDMKIEWNARPGSVV